MKRIAKYILVAATAAVGLSGCIKESLPYNGQASENQVTASPEALPAMVAALPTSMNLPGEYKSSMHCDFGYPAIMMITDAMLEEKIIVGDNTGYDWFGYWATGLYQDDSHAYAQYFWYFYYKWIKNTNDLIRMIKDFGDDVTETEKEYLGIAYAFRAKYYLDLARLYEFKENNYTSGADIMGLSCVIALDDEDAGEARNNGRAQVVDVYKTVLEDLGRAETLLANYAPTSISMPDLAVVYGLYARTYLEYAEHDASLFPKAAEYARKAIETSGCTPLTQSQWEDPVNGFNNHSACNAWMWGLTTSAENIGNLHNFIAHSSVEAEYGYAPLSMPAVLSSFFDKIDDNDFRKHSWIDPEREYSYKTNNADGDAYIESLRDYVSIKFRPYNGNGTDYKVGNIAEQCIMRVEEMYFIEAEAVGRTNLAEGKALLKSFMDQRILDGSYSCDAADFESFQQELIFQKRVEFWGEGISLYDCKRANIGMTRGYKGTNAPSTYCYNTVGRSPWWNIVITTQEVQNSNVITDDLNNPDPSGVVDLWIDKD